MKRLSVTAGVVVVLLLAALPLFAAEKAEITWFGHAAFKVVTPSGKVLLVDPWIKNPANPNGKKDLESLARVDLIFLTHGHGDHIGDAVEIAKKSGAKLLATFDLQKTMV